MSRSSKGFELHSLSEFEKAALGRVERLNLDLVLVQIRQHEREAEARQRLIEKAPIRRAFDGERPAPVGAIHQKILFEIIRGKPLRRLRQRGRRLHVAQPLNRDDALQFFERRLQRRILRAIARLRQIAPLLFVLYIDDMKNCSSFLNFILFADNTNILALPKDFV